MSVVTSEPMIDLAGPPLTENWLGAWETSADCAYCRDPQGRILAANLSFARKFGLTPAALVGVHVAKMLHPDDLGLALADRGQRADAIRHLEEALRLRPDYPFARAELVKLRAAPSR
jgi:PAS domain-containing protein